MKEEQYYTIEEVAEMLKLAVIVKRLSTKFKQTEYVSTSRKITSKTKSGK
jgi:hypothetical protein